MLLSTNDKAIINAAIAEAGQSHDEAELRMRDGVLWLRVRGNLENGKAVLDALTGAGINQVIDDNFETRENSVIYAAGAECSTVWIDFVDHEPLFRAT